MTEIARLAIFTICSNNYLPAAGVLLASARVHHPGADLFICLADQLLDEPEIYNPDWTVIPAAQLPIAGFAEFSFRYDIMELNTAVKPFMFQHLLRDRGYDAALYFDPDIEIFRPLDGVIGLLAEGASFVLTPHLLAPSEGHDEPNDFTMLRAGTYNLGFLGVGRCDESQRLLAWWARRLRFHCINAQTEGVFVDQKFIDLLPGFAPGSRIVHDPSLNVAYWNLSQRELAGPEGGWHIGDQPLTFFHYSGFDPNTPSRLSKHAVNDAAPMSEALRQITAEYSEKLLRHGYGTIPGALYAYGRFASGTVIHPLIRQMFREWHSFWPDDPFASYEAFLHEPWPGASRRDPSHMVTNFMKFIYDRSPYLNTRLDLSVPEHVRELVDWYVIHAAIELGLDLQLIEPITVRLGRHRRIARLGSMPPNLREAAPHRVTVVGYLRTASGVGEVGRQTLLTLAAGGVVVEGVDVALGVAAKRNDSGVADHLVDHGTAPVEIFNINADQLPAVLAHMGPRLASNALRINIPFWELSLLPEPWITAFAGMDEIWAPSRFIQTALAGRVDRPVIYMPVAIEIDPANPLPRARFGLPDRRFLFFYAFDFLSFMERKNPAAAIAAFRRAFATHGKAGLVFKCMNGSHVPDQLRAFRQLIDDDPDIFLIDETLSRPDTLGLIAAMDGIISLHRSEGLGLLVAEAMLLGKPVIATDYSATREFVTNQTGYPVGYHVVPVPEGDYPFATGQVWAKPDVAHAAWHMRRLAEQPAIAAGKVIQARAHLQQNHSRINVALLQIQRLQDLLAH